MIPTIVGAKEYLTGTRNVEGTRMTPTEGDSTPATAGDVELKRTISLPCHNMPSNRSAVRHRFHGSPQGAGRSIRNWIPSIRPVRNPASQYSR